MNQQDTKADQEQTESMEDLELTHQAAQTKAGSFISVKLEDCLVSNWSVGGGGHG